MVQLRITLDSGEVMLGVVGDESRMQATAVSSSFNTARMLEALFARFDANILCTEPIERWAGGYGSRYIGKTHDGGELTGNRRSACGTQIDLCLATGDRLGIR